MRVIPMEQAAILRGTLRATCADVSLGNDFAVSNQGIMREYTRNNLGGNVFAGITRRKFCIHTIPPNLSYVVPLSGRDKFASVDAGIEFPTA